MNDSPVYSKTLTFKTNNLGTDATLMLTFNKDIHNLHRETFPLCWKVSSFGKEGPYSIRLTFHNQLAFVKPQVQRGVIIDASTYKLINVDQKTTLTKDDNNVYHFSDVVKGEDGYLEVLNGCPLREDLLIGFTDPDGIQDPAPLLYFDNVGHEELIKAQFQPFLRAYITEQYQDSEIIEAEVSTSFFWEMDLASLDPSTTWLLTYSKSEGTYKISEI
ncbi:hypothetical protein PAXINDRAFT_169155 [Paxillus involutus ATCC 200175]|uniref:Uncharacterized protein n=1 Tax=Paxillus involutus ATCC 200175 TaxID=664439 RepID=A0A0C9U7E4_PAXIN|nr:hypothetical protein PAXINDRAFT_169155 [Paxillus involutus ATCC 200175]